MRGSKFVGLGFHRFEGFRLFGEKGLEGQTPRNGGWVDRCPHAFAAGFQRQAEHAEAGSLSLKSQVALRIAKDGFGISRTRTAYEASNLGSWGIPGAFSLGSFQNWPPV